MYLTDKISEKLLKNHDDDINTLLIIDEAQHLQPEVLEQLRLLTNLETNTKKLLQVILIGQPELQQLLQRRDLRQLAQRITARYHLMPLTKQELIQYIDHRLTVADCVRPLFDKGALSKIHEISQGIPRIINLLCHSALMLAYNHNDSVVDKKTVIKAAGRALGDDLPHKQGTGRYNKVLLLSTGLSLTALIAVFGFWLGQSQETVNDVVLTEKQEQVSSVNDKTVLEESGITPKSESQDENLYINEVSDIKPEVERQYRLETQYAIHTVMSGDTLYNIALKYNVSTLELRQWNNIAEENKIATGDRLYVVDPQDNSQAQHIFTTTKVTNNTHAQGNSLKAQGETTTINNETSNAVRQSDIASQVTVEQSETNNKTKQDEADIDYKVTQVEGVSSELLARFQEALEETEADNTDYKEDNYSQQSNKYGNPASTTSLSNDNADLTTDGKELNNVRSLLEMSQQFQNAVPALNFEQHIYSSDGEGWVKVNGRDRYEGDAISTSLVVEKILPQQVILSFQGETFSLPALTNW